MNKSIYIFLISCFYLLSCGSHDDENSLPYAPVSFEINLNANDIHLTSVGNIGVYISPNAKASYTSLVDATGVKGVKIILAPRLKEEYIGLGGLLIINTGLEVVGNSKFAAYDLSCPHERNAEVRIVPINNIVGRCLVCGSEFQLLEGTGRVSKGPSKVSLQQYRIQESSNNVFRIYR